MALRAANPDQAAASNRGADTLFVAQTFLSAASTFVSTFGRGASSTQSAWPCGPPIAMKIATAPVGRTARSAPERQIRLFSVTFE